MNAHHFRFTPKNYGPHLFFRSGWIFKEFAVRCPPRCWSDTTGAEEWMRDQLDLYEQYGWSSAYWAFREWDVMNIERTADPADKSNHADTPLLRLFKIYFAQGKQFLPAE